jgi:hypothetical protein
LACGILGGCDNGSEAASGTPTGAPSGASTATAATSDGLTISGIPALAAAAGANYSFHPSASDIGAAALGFAIKNQPAWSQFDTATGTLSGTPTAADIGSYAQIQITVSNGAATAVLPAFSISVTQAGSASALTISGDPPLAAVAAVAYSFHPTVAAPAGAVLTFSVKNLPPWAAFDPSTGALSGTPAATDTSGSAPILISVSDGATTASLAGFSIDVTPAGSGAADLSWALPTQNTSNTAELVGYHIYYGTSSTDLTHVVNITNPDSTNFIIDHLTGGTWYFAIKSYDASNVESSLSAVVPVPI